MTTSCSKRKLDRDGSPSLQESQTSDSFNSSLKRDILEQYFPVVRTLRQHVLSQLPSTSRIRRRKIATLGLNPDCSSLETRLANALDTALVCSSETTPHSPENEETMWQQWQSFSQKGEESYVTLSDGIPLSITKQSEVVDFVIWLLFSRLGSRPKHLLCDGFYKGVTEKPGWRTSIPGIVAKHPNIHVKALKEEPWPHILALLGQSGERVIISLLVDCCLFVKVEAGSQNYYQHSGVPLCDLTIRSLNKPRGDFSEARKLSDITLLRSRMFYAKPTFTSRGQIQFGYKHIHAMNRLRITREPGLDKDRSDQAMEKWREQNRENLIKFMMNIFPRQFGLTNVFTSEINTRKSTERFHDHAALLDQEIVQTLQSAMDSSHNRPLKIPKRLRGAGEELIRQLQTLHSRCSYFELIKHYCPTSLDEASRQRRTHPGPRSTQQFSTQAAFQHQSSARRRVRRQMGNTQSTGTLTYGSIVELASPYAHVSAFCQAVLSKIIPDRFWGDGTNKHNKAVFLRKVNDFIKLRRFESISLHDIAQDFKITDMTWLQPPNCGGLKLSQTDIEKRRELFHEFLYFCFDSLLIPLIRSNFYVTESNTHRLQVFYFRQDIWRLVSESAMTDLKAGMFEEIKLEEATNILASRRLGFSQIRLLPKGTKMRPITNLKRRRLTIFRDAKVLGPSINSVLQPIHTMLRHEKDMNPSRLGSTLFAVGDIYERLKSFKQSLGWGKQVLYFAKLDVTAAFDTIPQSAIVTLMHSIPRQKRYRIMKHAEVTAGDRPLQGSQSCRPMKRWQATAIENGEPASFLDRLESRIGKSKKNTIFIDNAIAKPEDTGVLLSLLAQHVGQNIVKIGKKFYRQKKGIPQGSVLSSFLCNYFYADLEAQHLKFLDAPDCLLMRLIDDFLLITLDKSKAVKFVKILHQGVPDYGVEVNPSKTLVNFAMMIEGVEVPRLIESEEFPYCGTLINCQTLDISKNYTRDASLDASSSLTVEYSRCPGQNFQRKVLHAFKIQSHLMFFDTGHNSTDTVLEALRSVFSETATKMWAYIRCLPAARRPSEKLIIRTISKVTDVSFLVLTSKSRRKRYEHYACDIRKGDVVLAAYTAFLDVLTRRQTKFGSVISWLRDEIARLNSNK